MLNRELVENKFREILLALSAKQYFRAEQICVNCIQLCKTNEVLRDAKILKHNKKLVIRLLVEIYHNFNNGMGEKEFRAFCKDEKNFEGFE